MQSLAHKKIFPNDDSEEVPEANSITTSASHARTPKSETENLADSLSNSGCLTDSSPYRRETSANLVPAKPFEGEEYGKSVLNETEDSMGRTLKFPLKGRFSPELNEFIEQMYIEAVDPNIFLKGTSFVKRKLNVSKKKDRLNSDKQFLLDDMVSKGDKFEGRELQESKEDETSGIYRKGSTQLEVPFEEITAQVLSMEGTSKRGFTSYDLISRTLHQLARDGNSQLLALALDRLGDQCHRRINQLDDQRLAPLHYAARYSHPYTILTLLQRKAKVNIRGQYGITPLHCAARYRKSIQSAKKKKQTRFRAEALRLNEDGSPRVKEDNEDGMNLGSENDASSVSDDHESFASVVKVLVENDADVNSRDVYGMTPLHYAAMRGHDVAARDLLTCGQVNIEAKDKQGMTPLFMSATFGYLDICSLLIDNGADIIAIDESQQTTLHRAAAEGHLEIVKLLLTAAYQQGGDEKVSKFLSMQDVEQLTPLHLAVTNGNIETARCLLESGADVNAVQDTLAGPLHAAAIVGNRELISLLIEHGANVEAVDCNQQRPLHKAAANNQGEAIRVFLEHNAKIEKRDKDAFTPLLLAAAGGHTEAISVLLDHDALVDVIDKDDRTSIYWCAQQGHLESLKVLLEKVEAVELIDLSDRFDNSPLHEASRNGYVEIVKLLLEKGSKIDNKNEDEETALHIAAETGQTEVVEEMIRICRFLINDENEDGNSPLHLASLQGREEVVKVLLEASADVEARNTVLWTPLDCASANGHVNVCALLIDYDSPLDPLDKTKTTPLQLAARKGHVEVINLLLKKGASVSALDSSGRNALEIAITSGQRDVAMAIVKSSEWLEALRNVRVCPIRKSRITPFRLLIQRFPDVAKVVLNRCMTTNGLENDNSDYGIKFNFEFIDDTYVINEGLSDVSSLQSLMSAESPYDGEGKLLDEAEPYTKDMRLIKMNHPLMLMVRYRRSGLLGHPVSVSLLKHKWLSYARFIYYFNLVFYIVFLSFLTGYVCTSIDWSYAEFLLREKNITISPSGVTCKEVEEFLQVRNDTFVTVGKWVIIVMTILNIVRELFQLFQARLNYIGLENSLEWICYVGAFLLVIDWTSDSECFIREIWQWQLGAVVIFLAWLNLVLFLRKLPLFGIYVVMFTDILATFARFFVVFFLFIVGFALSFFMVFRTQVSFEYVGKSLLKTSVMMVGEFEYDSIFNSPSGVQYPVVSYLLFVFFLILMSILVMNLLIGLAVDDIKAVQDQAVLKRRAMQTRLIMDVEVLIPESLRRYFATSFRKFFPNKKRSSIRKIFSDFNLLYTADYSQTDEMEVRQEDIMRSLLRLKEELDDLKQQNQKMYSLFTASLVFKKMRRLE